MGRVVSKRPRETLVLTHAILLSSPSSTKGNKKETFSRFFVRAKCVLLIKKMKKQSTKSVRVSVSFILIKLTSNGTKIFLRELHDK